MTAQGNAEWGDFPSTPMRKSPLNFQSRLDISLPTIGTSIQRPNGKNGFQRAANSSIPEGSSLPGIFGAYEQRRGSSGDFLPSARVRTATTQTGLAVPILRRTLTLERKRQTEIDTKTLDADGLKRLEKNDPFMYHSIPAVSSSSRFGNEVDLKEVQRPSRSTLKKSMCSCPSKMMTFASSKSDSAVVQTEVTTVKRRTRISHEVHTLLLTTIDDDDDDDDGDDGEIGSDSDRESDIDDDDVMMTLFRVMSKATV